MRTLYRNPTASPWNPGSRYCSTWTVIWSFLGCLLLLHLYSSVHREHGEGGEVKLHASIHHHPQLHELQQVENEKFQIPPAKRKRSPQGGKHGPKRITPLVDEFLDEHSQVRHVFFPGKRSAIDPMKAMGNDSYYYYPGRIWLDTDGNPIQAHGGGIIYDEKSSMYYWYGEYKDGPTYHARDKGAARVSHLVERFIVLTVSVVMATRVFLALSISINLCNGYQRLASFLCWCKFHVVASFAS